MRLRVTLSESINPWHGLPDRPDYVLPEDIEQLTNFNRRAKPEAYLHLNLIPEPFLGLPDALVVLLGLNPGYIDEDDAHHKDPAFMRRSRDNLLHLDSTYPFFLLDPAITAPGRRWWERKLRHLIERFGRETIAQRVLCVEYFPYHSRRFGHHKLVLPSQQYSFSLVRDAINREATIIVMRSKRIWLDAVPELNGYKRLCQLRNAQSPYISPRNCPVGFEAICLSISKGAKAG
jgi:hypothetical protein